MIMKIIKTKKHDNAKGEVFNKTFDLSSMYSRRLALLEVDKMVIEYASGYEGDNIIELQSTIKALELMLDVISDQRACEEVIDLGDFVVSFDSAFEGNWLELKLAAYGVTRYRLSKLTGISESRLAMIVNKNIPKDDVKYGQVVAIMNVFEGLHRAGGLGGDDHDDYEEYVELED